MIGNLPIADITREHAQAYFDWWNQQLPPDDPDEKPKKPKTAAHHFSDIRKLYAEYFRYMGEEDRQNPFRNMNFKCKSRTVIPAFPDNRVREKILVRGALEELYPADLEKFAKEIKIRAPFIRKRVDEITHAIVEKCDGVASTLLLPSGRQRVLQVVCDMIVRQAQLILSRLGS
ncbi:MAG: hypothetical protein OXE85_04540 [Roseovarius sp.]|nr:hypothetical protein [Roseovarius sp.]